ncbi:MAG TPA: hypothetical protein VFZ66_19080 [Herpetosiphonaceae bacterium]
MDWIYGPLHEALYMLERLIASVGWGFARSILYVVELIERFRLQLVTAGFRPAVQAVADQVLGISRSTLELGLVLGLLLLILQPVLVVRFVNLRKVFVLLLVVPVLLPFGGAIFQEIEQARADLGHEIFTHIFNGTQFDLLPADEERTGADRDMGPLVSYTPGSTALHAIDVAAAYLYAVRADVVTPDSPPPDDLPDAFAEKYFPYTPDELGNLQPSERWEAIEVAGQGIIRTLYGSLMVLFALGESVTNLLLTIGLGLLLIALLISLVFGWAAPVEHITANLLRKVCELILTSWGLSAIQGVLLAAIMDVATSGNAIATLGMGTLGMVMEAGFALLAAKTLAGALIGVAGAGSAGGISEGDVRQGARAVGGAALIAASGGAALAGGALGTGLAYAAASRQGASRSYAAGYALSRHRPLAKVGALAQAMGLTSGESDFAQGLYTGGVIGRSEPLSLRSQKALTRDTSQHQEQAAQQEQALGTLALVGLMQRRHQQRAQTGIEAQEDRFQASVQRNRERRQAQPATAQEPQAPPPLDLTPIHQRQGALLAPIPGLLARNPASARAAATAALGQQVQAQCGPVRPPTPQPIDGASYLEALNAHHDATPQPRRPFWEPAGMERVSAAGSTTAATAPTQEPIPAHSVAEHVTRQATAPGTLITPQVYARAVAPESPDWRIAAATIDLHAQYQARRATADTPPIGAAKQGTPVTRPRRRGPIATTQPKKERR